ncbi:efflux RND transporter periplasmic adaptor subunit [Maritimibacter sp. UBA3975]|uniref:efflux RND transporter periplasmic adaptor subunit n=1 Tax=Maritimibacter sp. UBA3975 TaxID=1946833 RepID=UPI0025C69EC8|nr:efflux RND transporter periplasmic adaptor subunit [Maritimibacter sp. UBA3975]
MHNPKPDWAMNKREKARAEAIAAGETPKRRKWPWVVLLVLVAGAAGGGYYAQQNGLLPTPPEPAAEAAPEAPAELVVRLAPFEVTTIAPGTLTETLRVTGSLTPSRQVHLSAEVSARLLEVTVREGDSVKEGALLARFDVNSLENQLAQAQSSAEATRVQFNKAQSDFERTQTLVERELAAPTALENARSGLEQLRAQLASQETAVENAQTAVEKARVTAPFDGVIAERQVDAGAFVATGSPLFTIVDLTSLEVEATAPVSISNKIDAGQVVDLRVEGFGDEAFTGEVERLNPMAISGSRMLPIYITLENTSGELRGGMFATGRITLEEKSGAIWVPVEAIREDAQGTHVLVARDGELVRRGVEVAREWDNGAKVEIASGLETGDTVVAAALPELRPGQKFAYSE